MLFRMSLPNNGKGERMGSIKIHFILNFTRVTILCLLMRTMSSDTYRSRRPYVYEIAVRDLVIYILNIRACLIKSYFSYCLTTLWLILQIYDRICVVFGMSEGWDSLKVAYVAGSFLTLSYNLLVLLVHRSNRYIDSFHEFGSDIRLYSKCNSVI